jgi:hypothetical protein
MKTTIRMPRRPGKPDAADVEPHTTLNMDAQSSLPTAWIVSALSAPCADALASDDATPTTLVPLNKVARHEFRYKKESCSSPRIMRARL